MITLDEYGIEKRAIYYLQEAYPELKYMDQLCQLTTRELSKIPGIGKKTVGYLNGYKNQYEMENKISKTGDLDALKERVSVLESLVLKLMNKGKK